MLIDYDFFINRVSSRTYLHDFDEYLKRTVASCESTIGFFIFHLAFILSSLDRTQTMPKKMVALESEVLQTRKLCEQSKAEYETLIKEYQERIKMLEAFKPDELLKEQFQNASASAAEILQRMRSSELTEELITAYLEASSKQRYINALRTLLKNHVIHS